MKQTIAIFASGSGTNAENIIKYFKTHPRIQVALVLSNKKDAHVLERAKKLNVATHTFTYKEFNETTHVLDTLKQHKIGFIVLAGFMIKVPSYLIQAYPNKMVNIHPALLPKFGGKGMYGNFVHEAVVEAKETESGITIHFVNEIYDDGKIIAQKKCVVTSTDTPDDVAAKVHKLEYEYYPQVIESVLT